MGGGGKNGALFSRREMPILRARCGNRDLTLRLCWLRRAADSIAGGDVEDSKVCCGPVCIALVQGIPAALVTLTVGIVGGLIAYQQAKVTRAKLKLDRFEKRYPRG